MSALIPVARPRRNAVPFHLCVVLEGMPTVVAIPWPIVDTVGAVHIALAGAVAIAIAGGAS